MSGLFSSGPDDQGETLPAFDDTETPRGSKRALLAGVAALAVLAGGGGGLFWLAGSPVADASAVTQPRGSAAADTPSPTSGEATSPSIALSGREIVAAPADDSGVSAEDPTAAPTSAASSSTTTTTTSSSAAPSARPATGSGGRTQVTPAPAQTTKPTTKPVPAPSTAAPWQPGQARFEEIPEGSTDGTGRFTLAVDSRNPVTGTLAAGGRVPSTSTVYQPHGTTSRRDMTEAEKAACQDQVRTAATSEAAAAVNRASDNCTTTVAYVWRSVFVPSSQAALAAKGQERTGWLVAAGTTLPDAVMGKVTGTVRLLAQRDKLFLVQVNRDQAVWIAAGAAVPGTPLVLTGVGLSEIERGDVAVFTNGGTKYFTAVGGGEDVGVSF
ncbi:hypothetical protein AB1207_18175 [Kineococcus endophyticus]|uniref:Uncharacterized protein n=1 Tax=Kineococcus endophyticus TaxID=1181883 RepID=A0ABV3PAL3_9ACTN